MLRGAHLLWTRNWIALSHVSADTSSISFCVNQCKTGFVVLANQLTLLCCSLILFSIPNIPHYAKNKAKGTMKAGHVFTIEPMINLGLPGDRTWDDNWTAVTSDGKRSAQFEHTILVTETGFEILTARENEPVMEWKPELITR